MRDLFMHLHEAEVLNVHWTREIEAEWTRNVFAKQTADPQAIQDCLEGMRAAAEGWEVAGYAKHTGRFEFVDAKDRHVAAAAYKLSLDDWPGQRVALVTQSIKDFRSAPSRTRRSSATPWQPTSMACTQKRRTSWRRWRKGAAGNSRPPSSPVRNTSLSS